MCVLGIMMALFERTRSGKGQVIDANMVSINWGRCLPLVPKFKIWLLKIFFFLRRQEINDI